MNLEIRVGASGELGEMQPNIWSLRIGRKMQMRHDEIHEGPLVQSSKAILWAPAPFS